MILSQEHHAFCLYEVSRLETIYIHTTGDGTTHLIPCIPGNQVMSGTVMLVVDECRHTASEYVVDLENDVRSFRQCEPYLCGRIERVWEIRKKIIFIRYSCGSTVFIVDRYRRCIV